MSPPINFLFHSLLAGKNNQWSGNEKLRQIARTRAAEYAVASKPTKSQISREMVGAMRSLSPPGRFLRKCSNSKWEDVGDGTYSKDTYSIVWIVLGCVQSACLTVNINYSCFSLSEIAREKTSQVLRDAIQSKKSFSGDAPTRIPKADRKRAGTPQASQQPPRIRKVGQQSKPTITAHTPFSTFLGGPEPPPPAYSSSSSHQHHRTPRSSVGTAAVDWRHPSSCDDRPRYHNPVSADSMDSLHQTWRHQHHHHHPSYHPRAPNPYGYQPSSSQYPITPAHRSSAGRRKRPTYQQIPPSGDDFSPPPSAIQFSPRHHHYHPLYTADTPPISAMFSPPNARMQAFSPSSASAAYPSLSSSQDSYSEPRTGRTKSVHPAAAAQQQRPLVARDSWICDVPPFSLSHDAANDVSNSPDDAKKNDDQLALYQEDLLTDSEHDHGSKVESISPVTFPPRRDSLS